jgi:hypothetical protein
MDMRDTEIVERCQRLIRTYEERGDSMHEPLDVALGREFGFDATAHGHEVAIGYLEKVLHIDRKTVGWIVANPMQVQFLRSALADFMEHDGAHIPRRGSDVEAWLKAQRDNWSKLQDPEWIALDRLLDDYRLRADTGTKLTEEIPEGTP